MRKFLTPLIALLVLGTTAMAQNSPNSNTGSNVATVNIILMDLQSIVVAPGQNEVNLIYDSKEKYENGESVLKLGHLQAFSTQNYKIEAAVWQENLITQNDIYVNNILLNRQFQEIFQGNRGSTNYDVTYSAKGDNVYLDKDKRTYTTQVIYSILPR